MKFKFATALVLLTPTIAWAQQADQNFPTDQAIPSLMFFTLGAALLIGIGGLIYFLRRRSNRAAMERIIKD